MPRGQEERSKLSTIILPVQNPHVLYRHCQFSQTRGCQLLQKIIWDTTFLWARVYGFMCNEPLEGLYHHLSYQNIYHCPLHISLLKSRSLEQRAQNHPKLSTKIIQNYPKNCQLVEASKPGTASADERWLA